MLPTAFVAAAALLTLAEKVAPILSPRFAGLDGRTLSTPVATGASTVLPVSVSVFFPSSAAGSVPSFASAVAPAPALIIGVTTVAAATVVVTRADDDDDDHDDDYEE